MAILVLMFVVIFVARHRFNRGGGIGVGGNCARRWRHEKPNGGATVEKVNGSVHVSFAFFAVRLREIHPLLAQKRLSNRRNGHGSSSLVSPSGALKGGKL